MDGMALRSASQIASTVLAAAAEMLESVDTVLCRRAVGLWPAGCLQA